MAPLIWRLGRLCPTPRHERRAAPGCLARQALPGRAALWATTARRVLDAPACLALALPCFALVVFAGLVALLFALTVPALPLTDLPKARFADLGAETYLPCRFAFWRAEGWAADSTGAAASSAVQSLAAVSAVRADTGTLSLAKYAGVSPDGLKFLEP
jgi:hypothetical protein